ncbi:MAG: carboxymuconolactone decarboxylase family protein [Solirubrobacteraceae bacterium]
MTRIEGVPRSKAGPLVRLIYRMTRRKAKQIAGADRELRIEPVEIYAHLPRLLLGYGMLEQSAASKPRVDERLRALAVLKSAVMQGCEFCQDIGSHEARRASVSDEQLLDLPRYRDSERFDETERLVLDLAVGMTATPVQVSDELFAALRARFDDPQLVELVNLIALENLRSRFNATFGIGAAGFSEGQVCARVETPADAPQHVAHAETPATERDRLPA